LEIGGARDRRDVSLALRHHSIFCRFPVNFTLGEWYMVHDEVWQQAWADRLKPWHALPGQQILCIGCLEARLGRTLMACDFTDAPVNDPDDDRSSERLRQRLTADGLVAATRARNILYKAKRLHSREQRQ
jgi:hypothetical protein